MEHSAHVRKERLDVIDECRIGVKEELRDALANSSLHPEETAINLAEGRGMAGQVQTAGDGSVGDLKGSSRLSTLTGYPLPRPPPLSQSTSAVSDNEYQEHRSAPSGLSGGSIPVSEAGCRARKPKTYYRKIPRVPRLVLHTRSQLSALKDGTKWLVKN